MKANLKFYEKSLKEGYQLDFGQIIEKSFDNFKLTWGVGGVAVLIFIVVSMVLGGLISIFTLGANIFTDFVAIQEIQNNPGDFYTWEKILITSLASSLVTGLIYPLTAGMYKIIYLANKKGVASFEGLFDFYSSTKTKDLIIAGILISFVTQLLNYTFLKLDSQFIGFFVQIFISLIFMFVVNIIIFCDRNFSNAMSESVSLFLKNPLIIFGLMIVAGIFALIGLIALCIGIVFTFFFIFIINYFIFDSIAQIEDETNEIDLIGQEEEF